MLVLKCWYNILSFLLDRKDSVGIDHIVVLWNIAEDGTIKKFKDDLEVTKFIVTSGAYDKLCAIACKGDDNFTKMLGTMHNYRRKIGCSFINDFCKELELEIKLFEGLLKPTKEDKELLCGMYKERAAYFIHNEHYDQAIQSLEKVTNLMPKDEQTIYHLAEAYMKHRQKNVKPQKAVSKALALLTKLADSGNVDAQEALGMLYSPHMQYTPECGGTIRRNQQRSEQCLQMAASKKPSVLFSQGMLTKNTDQMVRCFESLQEHGAKTEKEKKYVACIEKLKEIPGLSRKILSCKKNGPGLEKLKKRLYEIVLPQKTGLEELAKEHYLHAAIDVMRLSLILSNIEWKTGECGKMKDHVISIFRGLLLALDAGLVQNGTFSEIALDTYRDISQKLVELLIVSGLKDDKVVKSLISMINGRFQQLGVKDIRLVA